MCARDRITRIATSPTVSPHRRLQFATFFIITFYRIFHIIYRLGLSWEQSGALLHISATNVWADSGCLGSGPHATPTKLMTKHRTHIGSLKQLVGKVGFAIYALIFDMTEGIVEA